jgi:hypothetical protein
VLGSDRVREAHGALRVPGEHGGERRVGHGLERSRQELHAPEHASQDLLVGRDDGEQAVLAVLGLRHDVDGRELGVGALARHHHQLAGAGEAVDPHDAGHLALGLGHVAVAGAGYDIHGGDRLRSVCQRRDRLGAAHAVHLVHAAQGARAEHHRVCARGANGEVAHARDIGGHGGHDRRGWVGRAAAGDVGGGAVHGHLVDLHGLALLELHAPRLADERPRHGGHVLPGGAHRVAQLGV